MSIPSPTSTTMLLLAAADHNIPVLSSLLKTKSPNVQDPDTKSTPLHAAIASCVPEDPPEKLLAAEETLKLLLMNGAIWNELDCNGETPGCLANRLGLPTLYEIMVQAGVRAELIFGRLDGYQELLGGDEVEDEDEDEGEDEGETEREGASGGEAQKQEEMQKDVNSEEYLASQLTYLGDRLLDRDANGVMMAWERRIMERSCEAVLPGDVPGRSVLNIGFGMGIVDGFFRGKNPTRHVIVEPHPDVLKKMTEDGWDKMEGVEVLPGRWQDVGPHVPIPISPACLTDGGGGGAGACVGTAGIGVKRRCL